MRYFFVGKSMIAGQKAIITGSDAKHIRTVLRLKPGDRLGLYDGAGVEYEAAIDTVSRDGVGVSILSSHPSPAESPVRITVAQALLKARKMDGLIRQLTELGIVAWIPYVATHSVPKPDKQRLSKRMHRWHTITRESLKQCRRGRVVDIHPVISFEDVLGQGEFSDLKIIFYEGTDRPLTASSHRSGKPVRTILAILGPEGGFTVDEVEHAEAEGFVVAGLGPRILKAETATIAACSLVQYLFGDMG